MGLAAWGVIFAVWGIGWGALPTGKGESSDGSTAEPNYSWAFALLSCWIVAALVVLPIVSDGRSLRWEAQSGITALAGVVILAIALARRGKGASAGNFVVLLIVALVAIGISAVTGYRGWSNARRDAAAIEDFQSFLGKINEGGELPEIAPLGKDPIEGEIALHVTKNCYLTTAKLGQDFRHASVQSSIDELVESEASGAIDESLQALVSRERAALQALDAAVRDARGVCIEEVGQVVVGPELREAINEGLLRSYRDTKAAIDKRIAYLDEISQAGR